MKSVFTGIAAALFLSACATAEPTDPEPAAVEAPAVADHPLAMMFGEWVGPASGYGPGGVPFELTQTERVGPMLDGRILMVEGTGYTADGEKDFNAVGIIAPTGPDGTWEMRSYTRERSGTFPLEIHEDGFSWSIPAGPNASIKYRATIVDGVWTEIGHYAAEGMEPREIFRMTVTRIGGTDWPAGNAVVPVRE